MFLQKKLIRQHQVYLMIKKMQSIDLLETYAYETSKDPVSEKEEIK